MTIKKDTRTIDENSNSNDEVTSKEKVKLNPNGSKKKVTISPKIKEFEKKLIELEKERDELKDLNLRKAAEFDNFKRRNENEQIQLIANANADLITEMLPVFDDLQRSIQAAQEKENFSGLLNGVELITKNFLKVLEKRGVEAIKSIGEEFNPEHHEALMQIESDKHSSGVVVEEHLKGYTMNGKVLRHSQVLVSK